MKAKIRFWFDHSRLKFSAAQREVLQSGEDVELRWLKENARSIGLPCELIGWIKWDEVREHFYICEGDGRLHTYGTQGFEPLFSLPDPVEHPIRNLSAVIYFYSKANLHCGEYAVDLFGDLVKGILDYEVLDNGAGRYVLIVDWAPDLQKLSTFASMIRTDGVDPKTAWL